MTTYTIIIDTAADLLAACAPDGEEWTLDREMREYEAQSSDEHMPEFDRIEGVTLTNDEPEDEDCIVWRGHDRGWLEDANGTTYHYAVKAE